VPTFFAAQGTHSVMEQGGGPSKQNWQEILAFSKQTTRAHQ
jgi:hypothetical protein